MEEKERKKLREREREREREYVYGPKLSSMGVQTAFKVFYFERDNRGWKTKSMG